MKEKRKKKKNSSIHLSLSPLGVADVIVGTVRVGLNGRIALPQSPQASGPIHRRREDEAPQRFRRAAKEAMTSHEEEQEEEQEQERGTDDVTPARPFFCCARFNLRTHVCAAVRVDG